MVANTVLQVLLDLAENPMRVVDKFAQSLPGARHFSLSYVVYQALATQPFALVQLPSILTRKMNLFFVRTPRERANTISFPTLSMDTLYPQALLIFTLCILYSIVSPLIVIFGTCCMCSARDSLTADFGVAYIVVKYQLLNGT